MKFRIVYKAWWMFWADGMVVWPWMWFKPAKMHVSTTLYRHELQHCYQIARLGRFKFYASYLLKWFRYGYRRHPYELEAWDMQNKPLTEVEGLWLKQGRIGM